MTHPEESTRDVPTPAGEPAALEADAQLGGADANQPPHPPFARSPEEYTDPPGHHRRGPHGPALDVGA